MGTKQSITIITSLLGAVCVVLYAFASWSLSNTLDTNTYVANSAIAIDQPQIQNEVASTIVASVVGEAQVPGEIEVLLNNGAQFIVASNSFHSFWEFTNRTMHEIVRDQLIDKTPIDPNGAQISLTSQVDVVLQNLRQINPRLAQFLPSSAPQTLIQIADQETITQIKDAINGLQQAKVITAVLALVMFTISFLSSGLRRRSLITPSIGLLAASAVVYDTGQAIPNVAKNFIDDQFCATAQVIAEHMASSMSVTAGQILLSSVLFLVIALFPMRLRRF